MKILQEIIRQGGLPYFCGGYVRDSLLGVQSKDIDVEVFGMEAEKLHSVLSKFGKVDDVGQSFGVLKIKYEGIDYDFSLPRTEKKNGSGYKGFDIMPDPNLSLEMAAARRDFTFNAIYMGTDGKLYDPYNGALDLKYGILSATSPAYVECSLRPVRGFQLASRFNLKADEKTVYLSRLLLDESKTLSQERIRIEWLKWCKGSYPKAGLDFLEQCGYIQNYPTLDVLQFIPQHVEYYPEGASNINQKGVWQKGVWEHTKYVCQAMAKICDREGIHGVRRQELFFSALLHDVGKVNTTVVNKKGNWASPRHDKTGVPIAKKFLEETLGILTMSKKVLPLISEHMVHYEYKERNPSSKSVKKLAFRLGDASIEDLALLIEADYAGRPPLKESPVGIFKILNLARYLGVNLQAEKALVSGQDLIEIGYKPGVSFGKMLEFAYNLQFNGFSKDKILKQIQGNFKQW